MTVPQTLLSQLSPLTDLDSRSRLEIGGCDGFRSGGISC